MKQLKFRVWDKLNNRFLQESEYTFSLDFKYVHLIYEKKIVGFLYPENREVLQFIGISDKNNKEIYEGDILKVYFNLETSNYFEIGEVFYDQPCCCFRTRLKRNLYCMSGDENLEVIGNIFENKGLI